MRDARHVASTFTGTSGRRTSPHGNFRARLSSCARCIARNAPTRTSTFDAPRSHRFARHASGHPPRKDTPPGSVPVTSNPISPASAASAPSSPGGTDR